jgi:hypothetical protein
LAASSAWNQLGEIKQMEIRIAATEDLPPGKMVGIQNQGIEYPGS